MPAVTHHASSCSGFSSCSCSSLSLNPASAGPEPDQGPGQGGARPACSAPDFWFGQPSWSVGVRGSWLFASEGSDFFTFVQDQFTINSGDFNAPGIAVDAGVAVGPRADVLFGFEVQWGIQDVRIP